MNRRLPLGSPADGADGGTTSPAAVSRSARRLIAVMLVAAAALDLTRCGLVMRAVRHHPSAAGLVVIGLAAAALSVRTARGCQKGQRWAVWAALVTGAASAPQAAMSGFSTPYTIPDTATAVLGILLAAAVLATVGRPGVPGDNLQGACVIARHDPMIRDAAAPAPTHEAPDAAADTAADAGPATDGAAPGAPTCRLRLWCAGSPAAADPRARGNIDCSL
jgi:hypothetical protein